MPCARAESSSARTAASSGPYSWRMNTQPCSAPIASIPASIPSITRWGCSARIWRSLNVPGSDSSALQMTYLGSASWPATISHLEPVGNPAPPIPRSPASRSVPIACSSTPPMPTSPDSSITSIVS